MNNLELKNICSLTHAAHGVLVNSPGWRFVPSCRSTGLRLLRVPGSLALLVLALAVGAAEDEMANRLDELLKSAGKTGTPGVSVAVIQHGKPVYEKGVGLANLEYDIPVTVSGERVASNAWEPKDLEAFQGVYWSDELETEYTITLKDGKLTAEHIRHGRIELLPAMQDQFTTREWFMSEVKFQRDESGKVSGVALGGGRLTGILFRKKK